MTFIVDPRVLGAAAARADAEALELRTATTRLTTPDAGAPSAVVRAVLADRSSGAERLAACLQHDAASLRQVVALARLVDESTEQRLLGLALRGLRWSS